ncbi:MAG: hypothetical protein ACR2PA_11280 [Hyphomicrobiaceae bacterium]
MPRKTFPENLLTLGIDMGKTTCHVVGLDTYGAIDLREKISRTRICGRLANSPR